MLLGVIDVGNGLAEKFDLDSAARIGAEYALKNTTDVAGIRDVVLKSTDLDAALVTVESLVFCECGFQQGNACDATCPDNSALQKYVKVSVSTFYNPIFLPKPDQPETDQFTFFQGITLLSSEVTLRIQ